MQLSYYTICPRSNDPFYMAAYIYKMGHYFLDIQYEMEVFKYFLFKKQWPIYIIVNYYIKCVTTVCRRTSDPFYIVSYCIKWVTASWTHSSIVYGECLEKDDTRVNSAATGPNSSRNRLLGQEIFSWGGTNLDLEAWALPREAPRLQKKLI